MTAEQFTYWLQGFMEMGQPTELNANQVQIIKDHLKLVFDKQTPDRTQEPDIDWFPSIDPKPGQTHPYTGPDWGWKPNPYTVTCTHNNLNDPNKKFC